MGPVNQAYEIMSRINENRLLSEIRLWVNKYFKQFSPAIRLDTHGHTFYFGEYTVCLRTRLRIPL